MLLPGRGGGALESVKTFNRLDFARGKPDFNISPLLREED